MLFSPKAQLPWHRAQTASSPCIVFHHAERHKIKIAALTAHASTHLALTHGQPKPTVLRDKTNNRMLPAISLDDCTSTHDSLKPSYKLRAKGADGLALQVRNDNDVILPAKSED